MSDPAVRRIVVGVDGSEGSVTALRWACREAGIRGVEVHAIHVREAPLHSPASYAVPVPDEVYRPDDTEMWKAVLPPDFARGGQVRTETAVGLVARILLDRCQGADMLVLGAASDVPDQSWSAGPVIRACLQRAPCPVVVISADLGGEVGWEAGREAVQSSAPAGVPVGVGA